MSGQLKEKIQDCNINFLLGSGISVPYLKTLGNIERLLTEIEASNIEKDIKSVSRLSLYKRYFNTAISNNVSFLNNFVPIHHLAFFRKLNNILLNRKSTILDKQINLFTTNIDILLEKTLELCGIEFNDGFTGRFNPAFSVSNFNRSLFQKSLHYDISTELPVFNIIKLHGSITWKLAADKIFFSHDLELVKKINSAFQLIQFPDFPDDSKADSIIEACAGISNTENFKTALKTYEQLPIVNPTKDKFRLTLLNQTYYDMLRIYSNELEKENTLLFAMGFSFSDEHIKDLTIRAANSNPTLDIIIFAYDLVEKMKLETKFDVNELKNENVSIMAPPRDDSDKDNEFSSLFNFDLEHINSHVFNNILR